MSTTTFHLPDNLKSRATGAARRAEVGELADRRYAQILATGQTVPWEEMRRYLLERMSGQAATRPSESKPER